MAALIPRAISAAGIVLIYSLIEVSIAVTGAVNQTGTNSLCAASERVVFSASVAGSNKLVSICSSNLLDDRRGYLQYRFGRPGRVELQFPSLDDGAMIGENETS